MAHENLLMAGRLVRARRLERTQNLHLANVRIELETGQSAGLDGAPQEMLVQVLARSQLRRQERYAHRVQPGLRLEMNVGSAAMYGLAARDILIPIEQMNPL